MMTADEVNALQNAVPTDWSNLDKQLADRSNYNTNRFAGDDKLHVRFFTRAIRDEEASREARRPIYRDAEMIEIMIPGDKQNILCHVVEDFDRMRFPKHYEAFKAGREQEVVGTPLVVLGLSDSQIEELKYFKVRTLEQILAVPDNIAGQMMGMYDLKAAAKKFLDNANGADAVRREMQEKIDKLTSKLDALSSLQDPLPKNRPGNESRRKLL